MQKSYLAVDVYLRVPVNGYTVNSFIKKIEWARANSGRGDNTLKNRTCGMIVYRRSSPDAIALANRHGIKFTRLSEIGIDYETLIKEAQPTDVSPVGSSD
jgi:hypothetical protein